MSVEDLRWKRITAFVIRAVSDDEIDFFPAVDAVYEPFSATSRRPAVDNDDVAAANRPLALDTEQFRACIEDEVVAMAVGERLEDANVELDRCQRNRAFSDRPLLI